MNKYETMIITKPNLAESQRQELKEKITKKISSLKGKVLSYMVWKEQTRFSYPIKERGSGRNRIYEGTYLLVNFELPPENLQALKDMLRLQEDILRNLIVRSGE